MARILPKNKIKPLFIGFGNQALEYAKAFAYYNINIEAVCVNNLDKNKNNINKFKIKYKFNSIDKALSNNYYNCVFVFLPWYMIEKKIINILKNTKKNVFCEKPVALSYSKLIKIKKASNTYNKKLFILYNRRYYETLNFLKKRLKNIHKAEILIPEKKDKLIKLLGKKIVGKIKFHYTSHWIDYFKFLLNKEIVNFKKKNNNYFFFLSRKENRKANLYVRLIYSEKGKIEATFTTKNKIYRLDSLEKLYEYNRALKRFYLKINEKKQNKFKPGVLKLVKSIINNKLAKLKKIDELAPDYLYLNKLPY